ncbi:hypothetical protein PIB30_013084 [Stylosanthes scabra]|uniref:Uncharacterized protein n=1 Tax=Stylosanthes scabra TaxID=79078 RepID=A0ABU6U7U6_9FABA|nr:hypothetical protein [Stylosanthes scabra]
METENNTFNANIQDINADIQLHDNEPIHSNILDDLVGSMKNLSLRVAELKKWYNNIKGDIAILQVEILNNEDHHTIPKEKCQENIPTDKGKKVIEDNVQLEEDTDILLGGSDPEDTGTLVNGRKSGTINIIDLDEEIIAKSGNVNFTRTYLRKKAKKATRVAGDKEMLNKDNMLSKDSLSGRKRGRPKGSKGPRLLSKEMGFVLPVELKSKFRPTTEMQLTLQDCQISLYVFGYDLSEG